MSSKGQLDHAEIKIQKALGAMLKARRGSGSSVPETGHLDEDAMSAFVEGNLTEREATPVISHLADCSFCLHVSAELIKLDLAFAEESPVVASVPEEAQGIGDVVSGILTRIFGTDDGAVFAHEERSDPPEDPEKTERSDDD